MIYDQKPSGAEKTSSKINLERRTTKDYNNDPVVKLVDENRQLPGPVKKTPVDLYLQKQ